MAEHDDIAAALPQPPPPAPSRREAAIDAALRRFDGVDEQPAIRAGSRRISFTRAHAGALVTAALVALVGVPVALISYDQWSGTETRQDERAAADTEVRSDVASRTPDMKAPPASTVANPPAVAAPEPGEPSAKAAASESKLQAPSPASAPPAPMKMVQADALAKPAPSAPGENEVAARARREDVPSLVTGQQAPAAPQRQARTEEADEDNESIIVTSARRKVAFAGRGDWNACTVNDPNRNLRGCRGLVNPAAKGDAGRAAAHLADGLNQAWEGDLDAAIAAFDQAIAASPRYAFAYLNRGLARERLGDLDRALADINLAVRYAPNAARGYYHRSLLLRQKGDARRARFDEERAVDLDPRYVDALR